MRHPFSRFGVQLRVGTCRRFYLQLRSVSAVVFASVVLSVVLSAPVLSQAPSPPQLGSRSTDVLKEGRKLIDQRRYEDAISRFKQYCLMRPQDSAGYFWSGITYDEMGNYSASEKSYRDALERADHEGMDSAEIRTNLGNSLLKQHKTDDAISEYKRANEVDPLYGLAKLNLSRAYIEKGDGASALTALDKCGDLHLKGLHIKYYKAKALLLLGRKDEAGSIAKQLILDLPDGSFKNDVRQEFQSVI